jgi:uncharacterized protein with HEPN domain
MTLEEKKFLEDILLAISDIEEFVGNEKRFEYFNNNSMLKAASERKFEIIGEALRKFSLLNQEIEITHSREIIGLRNKIAHAYDSIDYAQLWSIIINHVPQLKKEVENLLN